MLENIKLAILAAQAVTDRWEVQHCAAVLLNGTDDLGAYSGLAALVQALDNLQTALTMAANDPVMAEAYECALDNTMQRIGDECVRLVLGDTAAQAAKDAADLAAAKQLARKLGVPHTFCV